MKYIIGLLIFYSVAGLASPGVDGAVKSNLVVVPFSIGNRPSGSVVKVNVPIKNYSSSIIRIKAIRTSCGCTTAKPLSPFIPPHGSDKIAIRIDSLGRSGPFTGSVLVIAESPGHPAWEINLSGYFVTPRKNLVASPPGIIDFGFVKPGKAEIQIIKIFRDQHADVGKLRIKISAPWIKIRKDSKHARGKKLKAYKITLKPPVGIGKVFERVRFHGTRKNDYLVVPLKMDVLPVVNVWPHRVLLMPHQTDYHLWIRPTLKKNATLADYRSQSDHGVKFVSVRPVTAADGRSLLNVRALPAGRGFISATLILRFKGVAEPVKVFFVGIGH